MTCAQGLLRLLWGGGARSWSATGLETHYSHSFESPKDHQQCHNHLHNYKPVQKIIIQSSTTPLLFNPENIDFFFQRFESLYRHRNLSSSKIFDKLVQSLSYNQCHMQYVLFQGANDYTQPKEALYDTYCRTIDQSIQAHTRFIPSS